MFRPVTTKEMKEHPWVTLKITNVVTGEEEERSFSLKNFLSRYTSVAEDYMHHGKYSVIGKFYDRIIWTFQIPTAATDGVRLFFNPAFVKEVIDKSSKNKGRKPRKYCKECSKIIENDIVSFSPKFCVDCGAELIIKANLKHRFTRCPVCQETRNKKLQADWVKNKRELLKVNKTNNVDIITPKTSI